MNYMNQTIRSQLRGTATSKTFRYLQESPNKTSGGKTTPATPGGAKTTEQTPTKISKRSPILIYDTENCNEILHLTRPPPEDLKANNLMNMEWILNLRKEEDESRFKKQYYFS